MDQSTSLKPNFSYLLLVSIIASLGGLMFGFDIAIISGAVPFIKDFFLLNEIQLGWGVSSILIGCIFGAMIAGRLSDRFGRKRLLIITALFFAVSCAATGLANDFTFFYSMRIFGENGGALPDGYCSRNFIILYY